MIPSAAASRGISLRELAGFVARSPRRLAATLVGGVACAALIAATPAASQEASAVVVATARGAAADCAGAGSNIEAGNAAASALFERRVVDPAGVGAAVRALPAGFAAAETFGARGDGVTDDSQALQRGLETRRRVWLRAGGVYLVRRRLTLASGMVLASDGSATLLMAAGPEGFDNRVALRGNAGLYSDHGTGLRLTGRDIALSDLFIVKTYADDRYVIGIDVSEASQVVVRRVRLRGFSLAPGIVTIRSSDDVTVESSLIHASCTRSTAVPPDVASFQITGISVDDTRIGGRGSSRLTLRNNVVADLAMAPLTSRAEQTDGINFAGMGTGGGSIIEKNDIAGVDEGVDLFGAGIAVSGNRIAARMPVKLIHGAHDVVVRDNDLQPGDNGQAIGMFRASPPEAGRQVHDILIEQNRLDLTATASTGIHADDGSRWDPTRIVLRRNRYAVPRCGMRATSCAEPHCEQDGETEFAVGEVRCD